MSEAPASGQPSTVDICEEGGTALREKRPRPNWTEEVASSSWQAPPISSFYFPAEYPPSKRNENAEEINLKLTDHSNRLFYCTWDNCQESVRCFLRRGEWTKHMDKHERPYRCMKEECKLLPGFTYSGGLSRHEREVHGLHGGPKSLVNCPHKNCGRNTGKGFSRQENLVEHIRRVHTGHSLEASPEALPEVPLIFSPRASSGPPVPPANSGNSSSERVIKLDRPYRCERETCLHLLGFTYSWGLLRHEREVHGLHGGSKASLKCPHKGCKRNTGKGFSRRENLNEHLRRVHTNCKSEASPRDLSPASSYGSADSGISHPPRAGIRMQKLVATNPEFLQSLPTNGSNEGSGADIAHWVSNVDRPRGSLFAVETLLHDRPRKDL